MKTGKLTILYNHFLVEVCRKKHKPNGIKILTFKL